MSSEIEICNMALSHLGQEKGIASFVERSAAANACSQFYQITRDMVLRAFPWPFATKIQALALVKKNPNDEWGYSYRIPSDCLQTRKIQSGCRNDDKSTRIRFRISSDDTGGLILTDKEDAILEYTQKITDSQRFSPDFTIALSRLLAFHIAPRIIGQDPFKLGEKSISVYESMIGQVEAKAYDEEVDDEMPDSEFIRERQ